MLGQLCRQNAIPRQATIFRHVGQERHVAIGERRQNEALTQASQPLDGVRPGVESMPDAIQMIDVGLHSGR